ncbi:hypothetical protein [Rhodococcoides kroppenstedtii]|uniref:hypothetical protein n=1 Tax=Rhodococcoides kroppenstedtii TaxID=293050 RepID=UPI00363F9D01
MGSQRPSSRGQKRAAKSAARRRRRAGAPTPSTVDKTLGRFSDWLEGVDDPETDPQATVRVVESLLRELTRVRPQFTVTGWEPDDAHLVLDAAESVLAQDTDEADDAALHLVFSSLTYLAFLDETDLWSGTDADFEHCMEDLTSFVDSMPDTLTVDDVTLPDVPADEEAAALADLPMIARWDALIAWSAAGETVSAATVANALRVSVPTSTFQAPADVPEIADLWFGALLGGLITTSNGVAAPGPQAGPFTARDVLALRAAVAGYVSTQLSAGPEVDVSASVAASFVAQTVLAAMTPDPPEGNLDEDYESLEGEDRRTAELVTARLKSLVDDGLLVDGEVVLVPPQLCHAVRDGLADADLFGNGDSATHTDADTDTPSAR